MKVETVSIGGIPVPVRLDEGGYFSREDRVGIITQVLRNLEHSDGYVELSQDVGTVFLDAFRDACELAWRYSKLSG